MLIILAGLPGTGKTTIARLLALRLGAVHLRIDSIEAAMVGSSLGVSRAEDAGYLAGYAVAEDNLRIGLTVVADSVNPIELTRRAWRAAADRACRAAVDLEIVCSDPEEHRKRVETRVSDIPGVALPRWQDVCDRRHEAWTVDRLVVDTALAAPKGNVDEILRWLDRERPS